MHTSGFIDLKTKNPAIAEIVEAKIILILAVDSKASSENDNDAINNDIVNPIPASKLAPYKCLNVTFEGSLEIFNFINKYEVVNMPNCFPRKRPRKIPKLMGLNIRSVKLLNWIVTPELASANIGIIKNADQGCRACSSLYNIDFLKLLTSLPDGIVIPKSTPAMVACIPDFKKQIHRITPKIAKIGTEVTPNLFIRIIVISVISATKRNIQDILLV